MSKIQWAAVGSVLVLGILSQALSHDHEHLPGHDQQEGMETSAQKTHGTLILSSGLREVSLDITGMT